MAAARPPDSWDIAPEGTAARRSPQCLSDSVSATPAAAALGPEPFRTSRAEVLLTPMSPVEWCALTPEFSGRQRARGLVDPG